MQVSAKKDNGSKLEYYLRSRRVSQAEKPSHSSSEQQNSISFNIFDQNKSMNSDQSLNKFPYIGNNLGETVKMYGMVGPMHIRKKILSLDQNRVTMNMSEIDSKKPQQLKLTKQSNYLGKTNTTINKNTILSKAGKDQQNIYTRQNRIKSRYEQYQQKWSKQSKNIKDKSLGIHSYKTQSKPKYNKPIDETLLERAVKKVYVENNRDKSQIISTNVTRYWEMSLRNNSKVLKLYMKGTKYQGLELQQLLQTKGGLEEVQKYIPQLYLKKKDYKGSIVLSGKKLNSQSNLNTNSEFPNLTQKSGIMQQEVFKIQYQSRNSFMSTQGL